MKNVNDQDLSRDDVDRLPGKVVLHFGSAHCGYCLAFAPTLEKLMKEFPGVQLIRIEDGPGKPLGRSFRIKLWPSLVFLQDGELLTQTARPDEEAARLGFAQFRNEETAKDPEPAN